MKLAFVVQRYGREILGGSETLARQLAERLSRRYEIEILTTTAQDYITWKNEYEGGEEKLRGVKIHRFPVEGERDLEEFNKFSEEIYKGQSTHEQELEWLERQGPVVPELVEYLKKEHERFDLIIFFTYLYYPTFYGLKVAPEKSFLIPTAHDEPPLRLGIFKEMFQLPSAFLFNTEAEELLVLERFPVHKKMRETIGMGMELLDPPDPASFRKKHDISAKYLLYAGRIDAGKGMDELFRYFTFYKEEHPATGNLQLVLIGKLGMKLPEDKSIRYIGFVDEADKLAAMAGAVAVVQSSRMESLSIVTLEAFSVGSPVLANGGSQVLVDHCRKSNAGFYYRDFEEFEKLLHLLLNDKSLARDLGKNGQRYIKETYGWTKLLPKYELAFRSSARPAREPKSSRRPAPAPPPPRETPAEIQEAREELFEAPSEAVTETDPVTSDPLREPTETAELEQITPAETSEPENAGVPPAPAEEPLQPEGTALGQEPEIAEEDVPEKLEHLPSFFRATLPPTPPLAERPSEEDDVPSSTLEPPEPEASDVSEPVEEEKDEEERTEPVSESDETSVEEEGLPEFFRPRPIESSSGEPVGQVENEESETEKPQG